jgi:hypothetical protein
VLCPSGSVEEYEATLGRLGRLPWYGLSDPRAAVDVTGVAHERGHPVAAGTPP